MMCVSAIKNYTYIFFWLVSYSYLSGSGKNVSLDFFCYNQNFVRVHSWSLISMMTDIVVLMVLGLRSQVQSKQSSEK